MLQAFVCFGPVDWPIGLNFGQPSSGIIGSQIHVFGSGGGNSGGVTACSLDDAPKKARRQKREIFEVGQREFQSRVFILFCCKGTVGSEAGDLSEPVVRRKSHRLETI